MNNQINNNLQLCYRTLESWYQHRSSWHSENIHWQHWSSVFLSIGPIAVVVEFWTKIQTVCTVHWCDLFDHKMATELSAVCWNHRSRPGPWNSSFHFTDSHSQSGSGSEIRAEITIYVIINILIEIKLITLKSKIIIHYQITIGNR